ncbi:MAG: TetR/AcrR family transcriptional regulator [Desulfomonilia bacterium]|nr:TetR/AcrR family transcriptional regulator [Deltaproteobacteria bacterium]MDX9762039.1 TetR/AcrR family transcriptional regulator [Desulfomonilia bacterium]HPW68533.1 TetR/AcrR family transcriptional regulator [Deltaproteobacteria bacterium]
MGRKSIREQRRKEILEALYRCLLRKPYNETSIKDIGMEAGINHAMLHYYFKSKEDILLCFIDSISKHYNALFRRDLKKLEQKDLTYREVLNHVFHFMNTHITTDKKLQTIFVEIWGIAIYKPAVHARVKKMYSEWIRELAGFMNPSNSAAADTDKLSMAVVAFQEGVGLFSVSFDLKKKDTIALMEAFQEKIIEMLE